MAAVSTAQSLFVVGAGALYRRVKISTIPAPEEPILTAGNDVIITGRNNDIRIASGNSSMGGPMMTSSAVRSRRAATADDDLLTSRHRRDRTKYDMRTSGGTGHVQTSCNSSAVVLLCSGKKCLEPAPESSFKTGRTSCVYVEESLLPLGDRVSEREQHNSIESAMLINMRRFSTEPSERRRFTAATTSRSATMATGIDPLVSDLCGYRKARTCWMDETTNDSCSYVAKADNYRTRKGTTATAAAEATARRHIWACQLPGSVKRSSRVAHGLSDLMTNLRNLDSGHHLCLSRPASMSSMLQTRALSTGSNLQNTVIENHQPSEQANSDSVVGDSKYVLSRNATGARVDGNGRSTGGQYTRWRPSTGRKSAGLTTPRIRQSLDCMSTAPVTAGGQSQTTGVIVSSSASPTTVPDTAAGLQLCVSSIGALTPRSTLGRRTTTGGSNCPPHRELGTHQKLAQHQRPVEEGCGNSDAEVVNTDQQAAGTIECTV